MNRKAISPFTRAGCLLVVCAIFTINQTASADEGNDDKSKQESSLSDRLKNALQHQTKDDEFLLRYRLKTGETHRWQVEHFFNTDTSLGGASEKTACRNKSINCWKIVDVDEEGNMTFQQIVEQINMWRKIDDQDPVFWNSQSKQIVPDVYKNMSSMVGEVQGTYIISPSGKLKHRQSRFKDTDLGIGKSVVEFPETPIKVGQVWHESGMTRAKFKNGKYKTVKTRQRYQLISVENGIATISFDTQLLTPIESPTIKSQLMQKMSRGSIKFDISKGKLVGRDIDWQSTVQGFEGADSIINYNARYHEVAVETHVNKAQPKEEKRETVVIKHRFAPPIIRR